MHQMGLHTNELAAEDVARYTHSLIGSIGVSGCLGFFKDYLFALYLLNYPFAILVNVNSS